MPPTALHARFGIIILESMENSQQDFPFNEHHRNSLKKIEHNRIPRTDSLNIFELQICVYCKTVALREFKCCVKIIAQFFTRHWNNYCDRAYTVLEVLNFSSNIHFCTNHTTTHAIKSSTSTNCDTGGETAFTLFTMLYLAVVLCLAAPFLVTWCGQLCWCDWIGASAKEYPLFSHHVVIFTFWI